VECNRSAIFRRRPCYLSEEEELSSTAMEFWGVEVKPGEALACDPGDEKYLHMSQAAIGDKEGAKENERVSLYVHVDGKKFVLGTLSRGKCDQIGLDLVFEKEFKLSHTSQSGSVFFSGYTTLDHEALDGFPDDEDESSEDEEEEIAQAMALAAKENGGKPGAKPVKPESKSPSTNKAAAKGKPEVKPPAKKQEDDSDEDDDDDDDDDEDMEDASESDDGDEEDDSDEESDEEDEEDEETPKPAAGKKRPMPDSVTKSPSTDKKAKISTPAGGQKPGADKGKKTEHVATPYPKQGGKGPASGVKGKETPLGSKHQTPGSKGKNVSTPESGKKSGQFNCQSCSRDFTSEGALSSHKAAKHGGK